MNKDESGIFADALTTGVIGTEWHRCADAGQVLDNYITIQTETGQRLILMQKESFRSRYLDGKYLDICGIRFKPVLKRDIPEYAG